MKLLLALFICFVIAAPEVQGCTHYITATGTVKCKVDNQYKPLPLVKVELLDDDGYLGNQRMADGRTNSNGEFSLTGSGRDIFCGKPDPKIKVVYDYSGSYGTMRIRNPLGQTRDHLTDKKRYSRYVTFNINIDDEHCRAYYRFYHCGLKYYYSTVQSKPPYGTLYVTTRATAVTPYAPHTKIKVPHSEDPISCETAKHEFAHTIRHHYDGTYEHFLSDAGRFWYLRSHGCTDDTNAGFAFNEGWAEYWEDSCTSYNGSNYRIEGNVASALKRLAEECSTSRAQMVDVLKYNRGNIHSFCDFNYRHGLRFRGCKLTLPKCSCLSTIGELLCKIRNWG